MDKSKKEIMNDFRYIISMFHSCLCDLSASQPILVEHLSHYLKRPISDEYFVKFLSDSSKIDDKKLNIVRKVSLVLALLSEEEREIIVNDFINLSVPRVWWLNRYSRSTYYRKREEAVNKFYELFDRKNDTSIKSSFY